MVKRPRHYDHRQGDLLEPELPLPDPVPRSAPAVAQPENRSPCVQMSPHWYVAGRERIRQQLAALDAAAALAMNRIKGPLRPTKAQRRAMDEARAEVVARTEPQRQWLLRKLARLDRLAGNPQSSDYEASKRDEAR